MISDVIANKNTTNNKENLPLMTQNTRKQQIVCAMTNLNQIKSIKGINRKKDDQKEKFSL